MEDIRNYKVSSIYLYNPNIFDVFRLCFVLESATINIP